MRFALCFVVAKLGYLTTKTVVYRGYKIVYNVYAFKNYIYCIDEIFIY